jgi:serine/threonine protein kinase
LGFYHWIWNHRGYDSLVLQESCHQFSLASIKQSTKNFDENNIIGNESLGIVYRGCLKSHNGTNDYAVMIKRVSPITEKILRRFKNEIELQCRNVHPNLVNLLGYCDHKNEKIIVYDYNSNGSLHNRLCCIHNGLEIEPLTWKQRLKICIGAACGLNYLHDETYNPIFHGNIQSQNILLDSNMVPKLSDFWICLQGPVRDNNSIGMYHFLYHLLHTLLEL